MRRGRLTSSSTDLFDALLIRRSSTYTLDGFDQLTGRFTQEDPIGLAGGLNLYGFANMDPVNFGDAFGLSVDTTKKAAPTGPPPYPVPGGGPGTRWKWNPDPNNPRGGTWGPDKPIPGQGQPSSSWDPEGHWDSDNGKGDRQRYDEKGNPLTPEQAHGREAQPEQGETPSTDAIAKGATIASILYILWQTVARLYPPRNLCPC